MTRPSERELRHAVDSLDDDEAGGYPVAPLAILLSADELRPVDSRKRVIDIDGELYRRPNPPVINIEGGE